MSDFQAIYGDIDLTDFAAFEDLDTESNVGVPGRWMFSNSKYKKQRLLLSSSIYLRISNINRSYINT